MLLGMVSIEPGGSKVVKSDFSALADRLSPRVQRMRRESAIIPFCRVIGTIWAPESGCVVIASAPLQNPRSIPSMTRKLRAGYLFVVGLAEEALFSPARQKFASPAPTQSGLLSQPLCP